MGASTFYSGALHAPHIDFRVVALAMNHRRNVHMHKYYLRVRLFTLT